MSANVEKIMEKADGKTEPLCFQSHVLPKAFLIIYLAVLFNVCMPKNVYPEIVYKNKG
uniref:Uncharacterized protein n=1 Tax=Anguilla anguilla TaxID=7936 RepID=A0A0E9SH94_ANGAN